MENAHAKTAEECLAYFNVDQETGLSDEQLARATEKFGPNGNVLYLTKALLN